MNYKKVLVTLYQCKYVIPLVNSLMYLYFDKAVEDELDEGTSYTVSMQAMTEEGNSVNTPFSDEIQTLPVGAEPGT